MREGRGGGFYIVLAYILIDDLMIVPISRHGELRLLVGQSGGGNNLRVKDNPGGRRGTETLSKANKRSAEQRRAPPPSPH